MNAFNKLYLSKFIFANHFQILFRSIKLTVNLHLFSQPLFIVYTVFSFYLSHSYFSSLALSYILIKIILISLIFIFRLPFPLFFLFISHLVYFLMRLLPPPLPLLLPLSLQLHPSHSLSNFPFDSFYPPFT